MRRIFFIASIFCLFMVMLSSCRTNRQVVQQTRTDSTSVTFADVVKTVSIPGDTVVASFQVKTENKPDSGTVTPEFTPQKQVIDTKRTQVTIELTRSGELKATAITKPVEEKITLQEKTITRLKNEVTQVEAKDSWFKRLATSVYGSVKTILVIALLVAAVAVAFKLGFNPLSILKNLFKKS